MHRRKHQTLLGRWMNRSDNDSSSGGVGIGGGNSSVGSGSAGGTGSRRTTTASAPPGAAKSSMGRDTTSDALLLMKGPPSTDHFMGTTTAAEETVPALGKSSESKRDVASPTRKEATGDNDKSQPTPPSSSPTEQKPRERRATRISSRLLVSSIGGGGDGDTGSQQRQKGARIAVRRKSGKGSLRKAAAEAAATTSEQHSGEPASDLLLSDGGPQRTGEIDNGGALLPPVDPTQGWEHPLQTAPQQKSQQSQIPQQQQSPPSSSLDPVLISDARNAAAAGEAVSVGVGTTTSGPRTPVSPRRKLASLKLVPGLNRVFSGVGASSVVSGDSLNTSGNFQLESKLLAINDEDDSSSSGNDSDDGGASSESDDDKSVKSLSSKVAAAAVLSTYSPTFQQSMDQLLEEHSRKTTEKRDPEFKEEMDRMMKAMQQNVAAAEQGRIAVRVKKNKGKKKPKKESMTDKALKSLKSNASEDRSSTPNTSNKAPVSSQILEIPDIVLDEAIIKDEKQQRGHDYQASVGELGMSTNSLAMDDLLDMEGEGIDKPKPPESKANEIQNRVGAFQSVQWRANRYGPPPVMHNSGVRGHSSTSRFEEFLDRSGNASFASISSRNHASTSFLNYYQDYGGHVVDALSPILSPRYTIKPSVVDQSPALAGDLIHCAGMGLSSPPLALDDSENADESIVYLEDEQHQHQELEGSLNNLYLDDPQQQELEDLEASLSQLYEEEQQQQQEIEDLEASISQLYELATEAEPNQSQSQSQDFGNSMGNSLGQIHTALPLSLATNKPSRLGRIREDIMARQPSATSMNLDELYQQMPPQRSHSRQQQHQAHQVHRSGQPDDSNSTTTDLYGYNIEDSPSSHQKGLHESHGSSYNSSINSSVAYSASTATTIASQQQHSRLGNVSLSSVYIDAPHSQAVVHVPPDQNGNRSYSSHHQRWQDSTGSALVGVGQEASLQEQHMLELAAMEQDLRDSSSILSSEQMASAYNGNDHVAYDGRRLPAVTVYSDYEVSDSQGSSSSHQSRLSVRSAGWISYVNGGSSLLQGIPDYDGAEEDDEVLLASAQSQARPHHRQTWTAPSTSPQQHGQVLMESHRSSAYDRQPTRPMYNWQKQLMSNDRHHDSSAAIVFYDDGDDDGIGIFPNGRTGGELQGHGQRSPSSSPGRGKLYTDMPPHHRGESVEEDMWLRQQLQEQQLQMQVGVQQQQQQQQENNFPETESDHLRRMEREMVELAMERSMQEATYGVAGGGNGESLPANAFY